MSLLKETPLKDAYLYNPRVFEDARGYFMESFNAKHFEEVGLNPNFVQDNRSYSKKGTLRGMHFQVGDYAQAKLVGVLEGEVLDAIVDLRPDSPSFKKSYQVVLSAKDKNFLYVPRGFAHGFQVLSETAEFFYKCDNFYSPQNEGGIHYNDPKLGITWEGNPESFLLSDKDKILPTLEEYLNTNG